MLARHPDQHRGQQHGAHNHPGRVAARIAGIEMPQAVAELARVAAQAVHRCRRWSRSSTACQRTFVESHTSGRTIARRKVRRQNICRPAGGTAPRSDSARRAGSVRRFDVHPPGHQKADKAGDHRRAQSDARRRMPGLGSLLLELRAAAKTGARKSLEVIVRRPTDAAQPTSRPPGKAPPAPPAASACRRAIRARGVMCSS